MKCRICFQWILKAPIKHNNCGHYSMCNKCYEQVWRIHDLDVQKSKTRFDLSLWARNGGRYEEWPHSVPDVKCAQCNTTIKSRGDGVIAVDWSNHAYNAEMVRKYGNQDEKREQRRTKLMLIAYDPAFEKRIVGVVAKICSS